MNGLIVNLITLAIYTIWAWWLRKLEFDEFMCWLFLAIIPYLFTIVIVVIEIYLLLNKLRDKYNPK